MILKPFFTIILCNLLIYKKCWRGDCAAAVLPGAALNMPMRPIEVNCLKVTLFMRIKSVVIVFFGKCSTKNVQKKENAKRNASK